MKIVEIYLACREPTACQKKGKGRKTMPENTRGRAYALVKSLCANYDRPTGECLPLECDCPQLKSQALACKYFREAVLPADKVLEAEIMKQGNMKTCEACGKTFRALSNAAKYCTACGERERKRREAERSRRNRAGVRKKDINTTAF